MGWMIEPVVNIFSPSFQESFLNVCQKCTPIYTEKWNGSWTRWAINCLQCITQLFHILSVCKGLDSISCLLSQEFSVSLSALDCLTDVAAECFLRYWARKALCKRCFHPGALGFHHHSHQTRLHVGELLVLRNSLLKNVLQFERTVQFSSRFSEIRCTASYWCLAGWICKLRLLTSSLWSVQQSATYTHTLHIYKHIQCTVLKLF